MTSDHRPLQLVHHRRPAAVTLAHRVGSIMVALAAASASVIDPFGNLLGVMYNQHYLDVLAARPGA